MTVYCYRLPICRDSMSFGRGKSIYKNKQNTQMLSQNWYTYSMQVLSFKRKAIGYMENCNSFIPFLFCVH